MNLWKRLFTRKTSSPSAPVAAPDTRTALPKIPGPRRVLVGSAQSVGMERSHNEDSLLVMLGTSAGELALADFGLFIVADGMGGHRLGEVASSVSVRAVTRHITRQSWVSLLDEGQSEPLLDTVRHSLEDANQMVAEMAPGGGTTLTVGLLLGDLLTIGHVGDSRAYLIKDGLAEVITRDHSYVERLLELGRLRPEEAIDHPQRNVLYRAIGQGNTLEIDAFSCPTPKGGHLLICSDGLWGVVPDQQLQAIINRSAHPQEACDRLVEAANQAGGPDNISAVLVYFPPG